MRIFGRCSSRCATDGLLPEFELSGVYSRTAAKAIVWRLGCMRLGKSVKHAEHGGVVGSEARLLVEAASPAAMKEVALAALKNGTSIITPSIGAFADTPFYEDVKKTAKEHGQKVYIASGATGGFDVLRTATLMGNASAQFYNGKGVAALRRSRHYSPEMEKQNKVVFTGTAREAIDTFPTGLNVAVAASLATVGPEQLQVTMESTPDFTGDRQRVEIKNNQVHAVVDVFSATPEIAAWSVVATMQNIVSPIRF